MSAATTRWNPYLDAHAATCGAFLRRAATALTDPALATLTDDHPLFLLCALDPVQLQALYQEKRRLRRTYAFAVPNDAAVEALLALGPIVELGAGSGYWAAVLARAGGDVVAYDDGSWGFDTAHHAVRPGDATAAARHPDRALLLCWPPYGEPLAADALHNYAGNRVAYVGETRGCTADDAFHDALDRDWSPTTRVAIPTWPGVHDDLTIYRRGTAP